MNTRLYRFLLISLSWFFYMAPLQAASPAWQALGPSGGNVNALVQTANGDNVYAATPHGVYLSRNQGASWRGFVRGLQGAEVKKLLLDEAGQRLLALTEQGLFISFWVNDELIWRVFNQQLPAAPISDLAFDADAGVFYAWLAGRGLYQRGREATAWQPVSAELAAWSVQALRVVAHEQLLVVNEQALFLSNDAGLSWQTLAVPAVIRQLQVVSPAQWWLMTDDALWKTQDAGLSWQTVARLTAKTIHSLFVQPSSPPQLYLSTDQGNFSRLDGYTWQPLAPPMRNVPVQTWAVHPSENILYAGTQRGLGVFKSDVQTGVWEVARFGLQATEISTLQITEQAPHTLYAAVSGTGLFKRLNGGSDWTLHSLGLPSEIHHVLTLPHKEHLYAATAMGIFTTQQGNPRWLPELNDIAVQQLIYDPLQTEQLYAATAQGVYAKNLASKTATWQLAGLPEHVITALLATPDGSLYAGTQKGLLFEAQNNAAAWTLQADFGAAIHALHIYQNAEQDTLFAATATGAWRYVPTSGWQAIADLSFSVQQFASAVQLTNTLYAATARGIFRSQDAGQTWHSYNKGLPLLPFSQIRIAPTQPLLIYAASQGAGVFRLALDDLQAVGLNADLLKSLSAEQLSALPASHFAAFNADSLSLLPADSLQGLNNEQLSHLSADALRGLSVEQFQQIPDTALFGLHTDNFAGLSRAILQSFSTDTLQALDKALLQRLDSHSLSRLLEAVDTSSTQLLQNWPRHWQPAALPDEWQLPIGTPLPIAALPTALETPNLTRSDAGNLSLLNRMQAVLDQDGFAGYQFNQDNTGIVSLNSEAISYAYLPASVLQSSPLVAAGWQFNAQGQVQVTTKEHQQITLNPSPYSLQQLALLVGEQGWFWLNDYGDALLFDNHSQPPQYRMLSFSTLYSRTATLPVGIFPLAANRFNLIYPAQIQQQAAAAIPQPQALVDALYRFGAELAFYHMDGTCIAQFDGIDYVLQPQAEIEVRELAEGEEPADSIQLYTDANAQLWLDYTTQWRHLKLLTRLQVKPQFVPANQ